MPLDAAEIEQFAPKCDKNSFWEKFVWTLLKFSSVQTNTKEKKTHIFWGFLISWKEMIIFALYDATEEGDSSLCRPNMPWIVRPMASEINMSFSDLTAQNY